MRKISISFLVGFAAVATAGAASAQGGADVSALSNSVSSQILSVEGLGAKAKLGEAKPANPYAQTASALTAAPAGTGIDIPVVTARIGSGVGLDLPSNALTDASRNASANMANALQASQPAGDDSLKTTVVLGASMSELSNAVSDEIRSTKRIGK